MLKLPSYAFPASALKLGGLEVIGNLYPVILIVAVNAYEDEEPTEASEFWKDFRLTILVPALPETSQTAEMV
ncbi:hypothetical protein EIP86_007662 [Pleurotus ostreatoroseus]|nr:hypothetical protein EIP86_007662 [Pleurotus ostreatoroseus]